MSVMISLLRGVNLGGHHKIKMDALRALYKSLGLRDPQTFIQSGNVIFKTDARDLHRLARRIEDAIEQSHGFRPDVVIRTTSELRQVIRRNPFGTRQGIDPAKLLVVFLADDPGGEAREKVSQMKTHPEELHIEGREVFIHYPDGMGRTKLPWTMIERALATPGTGRNWNSVTKLLALAESLEASE